ncbi:hypothetical protein [Croceicoccus pelagius]|nr:hypothetical protein [Croceicoccus pelagius]
MVREIPFKKAGPAWSSASKRNAGPAFGNGNLARNYWTHRLTMGFLNQEAQEPVAILPNVLLCQLSEDNQPIGNIQKKYGNA